MNEQNYKALVTALRLMIENDCTEKYIDTVDGEFDQNDENAHWLGVLQKAQKAYYDATGEIVANDMGVILISDQRP